MLDLSAAFAAFPTITTDRLVLRRPHADDAEPIFRIMSNPVVTRYFGSEPMHEPAQAVRRIEQFHADFSDREGIRWAIVRRADDQFLGTCGFWRVVKAHYRAEIGYELDPEWWGRGIMTEAVAAVLNFGFDTMRLHSVEAQIAPENVGSQRVLEKVGFRQEAYFRENYYDPNEGRFTDTAVFSLLQSTWRQQR